MNESNKVVTNLDSGIATPIAISKSDAYNIANKQTELNNNILETKEEKVDSNFAEMKPIQEVDLEKVNYVNDFIKVKKKKTPILTYIIMILVLVALVLIFIIFELPILRGL